MFPTVFINHGGGPLPLLGRPMHLVSHMREVVKKYIPEKPKAIVVLSAHWENDPVSITSSPKPSMLFDYSGFPPETYKYEYPAPGSPDLAQRILDLLQDEGIESELNPKRGYDHGVFVPLMIMYPEADIPVVCVSLHSSLSTKTNMAIGSALQSLRKDDILILGSGFSFHNMQAFFRPTSETLAASLAFNTWLKGTILNDADYLEKLKDWEKAPGAKLCHPRQEHMLPLVMAAAAGGDGSTPVLIYDSTDALAEEGVSHAVSGYLFQ